jgi:hypothetical protein
MLRPVITCCRPDCPKTCRNHYVVLRPKLVRLKDRGVRVYGDSCYLCGTWVELELEGNRWHQRWVPETDRRHVLVNKTGPRTVDSQLPGPARSLSARHRAT